MLGVGTQKRAASTPTPTPRPEPITRRRDLAPGNVQLFVEGISPRDPRQPPCPRQVLSSPPGPSPASLSPRAAAARGLEALPAGCH